MPSLYNIGQQYEALAQLHDEANDEDAQHIVSAWLAETDEALGEKAANCIRAIKQWEADEKAQAVEMARLMGLRRANTNRIARLKQALKEQLERAGMTSLTTPVGRLTVQGAGGQQAVLGVDAIDAGAFAKEHPHLVKTKHDLDKTAIHAALMLGEEIPGLSLAERGTVMVIR